MSGASIGIIVPCVQAWTQTLVDKFTGLIGAARSADAADPLTSAPLTDINKMK